MTELAWPDVRRDLIAMFNGEAPGAQIEDDIVTAFREHPAIVMTAAAQVADRLANGKVQRAWPILRLAIRDAVTARSDATAEVGDKRELRVRQAEAWIRNAGLHFDRETEVEDALFGDLGSLREWASDDLLRRRLLDLWRSQRPRGERTEAQEVERAVEWWRIHKPPAPTGRGGGQL